jgi:hypothetical protein
MKNNPSCYFNPEHLPPDVTLADPRNMKHQQIVSFFEHVMERQQRLEPAEVFGFKTVKRGRKGTRLESPAESQDGEGDDARDDNNVAAAPSGPLGAAGLRRPRPKSKAQNKSNAGDNDINCDTTEINHDSASTRVETSANLLVEYAPNGPRGQIGADHQITPGISIGAEGVMQSNQPNSHTIMNAVQTVYCQDHCAEIMPQLITDSVIDPALLQESEDMRQTNSNYCPASLNGCQVPVNHKAGLGQMTIPATSKKLINTADDLARQEAERYFTEGKRVRVARQRE